MSSAYDNAVLADSPVAFWPLNETSGTSAADATGNGHTGTYTGGFTLGATGIGDGESAVALNGSTGYVTVPSASTLQLAAPFSIEAWVSPTSGSAGGYCIVSKFPSGGGGDDYLYGLGTEGKSAGHQNLAVANLTVNDQSTSAVPTGWHHVVVTYNGSTVTFYKDGVADGTPAGTGNPTKNTGPLTIGTADNGGSFGSWFSGSIAKVALYSVALTSTQVSNHYAAATAVAGTGAATFSFGGSATGSVFLPGSGAGSFSFSGTATGSARLPGTGTGTFAFTGTATGTAGFAGTGTGSFAFTGSATGKLTMAATANGTYTFTGTAAGTYTQPTPPPIGPGTSTPMVGNPFIYRAYTLTTLEYLGRLPFTNCTFGRSLNQPGPFQAVLNITDPAVQATAWREASMEAATLIVPELYGVPLGGWELWGSQYQSSSRGPMQFQGQDALSYFQNREQAYDYTSTWNTSQSGDPMAIMAQLIQDVISVSNANGQPILGLTPSSVQLNPATGSPSGATVSVSYPASSLQQLDSMLSTLSQMGYGIGPDYSLDMTYQQGTKTPVFTINIWSPRRGRTVQQSNLKVQHQQLIDSYYPVAGTSMATHITEMGSGTGGVQPVTLDTILPGYPRYDKSFVHTQVNTESALEQIAFGDASLITWPVVNPWIRIPIVLPDKDGNLDPSAPPQPGTYDVGDDIQWTIDPVTTGPSGEPRWGLNNNPRFPAGFSFEFRIQDWAITVADKGVSYAQLDLGIPPTGTLPPPQPPL